MKRLLLCAALAAPFSTLAATPEELGALASPIAFLDTCAAASVLEDVKQQAPNEWGKSSAADKEFASAVASLSDFFCVGVVQTVVHTVMSAQEYRLDGQRVCVDPDATVDELLVEMREKLDADTAAATTPTPTLLLQVLSERSDCPA